MRPFLPAVLKRWLPVSSHGLIQTSTAFLVLLLIFSSASVSQATWWFLSQLPVHALGTTFRCDNIPGLAKVQRRLCRQSPALMISIGQGARMGVTECQHQFLHQRWNCSIVDRESSQFGKIVIRGSKEAAFVYAISSAGVVFSITRACSRGDLRNCACDPKRHGKGRDSKGEFNWGGCSDNFRYGTRFSRLFIDAKEKKVRDATALMNLHNNRAGRKAVQKFMKLECKCHGVSGSCAVRTCWLALQEFRKIGNYLHAKYDKAIQVTSDQDGTGLRVAKRRHRRKPTRNDLVYFEESPDYCEQDDRTGSLGTSGRVCNKNSSGPDGCNIMCCGRGYNTITQKKRWKCQCKFVWCCRVQCKTCVEWVDEHRCKGPGPMTGMDSGSDVIGSQGNNKDKGKRRNWYTGRHIEDRDPDILRDLGGRKNRRAR